MANKISLTTENTKYLIDAFTHFFPEDTIYSADKPYVSGEFNWKDRQDFIDFIYRLTGVLIKSERDLANIKKAQLALESLTSDSTEKDSVETNMPDKEAREMQEIERQKREAAIKESQEKAQKTVEKTIERKIQIRESTPAIPKTTPIPKEDQVTVLNELKNKAVYVIPAKSTPKINFTEPETKLIEIAKNDAQLFSEKLSELIVQKNPDIPQETIEPLSKIIAVDTTKGLINPVEKTTPPGVFAALAKAPNKIPGLDPAAAEELTKTVAIFTAFSENQDDLYRTVLKRSLGENITNHVLGFQNQEYLLSDTLTNQGFTIKLDQLQENSFAFQESPLYESINNPVSETAKSLIENQVQGFALDKVRSIGTSSSISTASRFANSKAFESIAPFLGIQTNFTYIGTGFFGKTLTTMFPEFAPLIYNTAEKLGINVGIKAVTPLIVQGVAETGGAVAAGAASKAVVKVAAKTGLKASLTAAGQALGSFAPIVGNILAFIGTEILGKIIEKIPWDKVKKYSAYLIGLVMGLGSLVIAGPLAGALVGLGSFGIATIAKGGSLGQIGAGFGRFFSSIGSFLVGSIAMPVLIALLVFPVIVALILFIINSGAYIVPPTTTSMLSSNPYIAVEKVATPAGPFDNSNLPLKISYKITVTAKKGILTNIAFEDDCLVINKTGTTSCQTSLPSEIPESISPSIPYTFTYESDYSGNAYRDSIVIDTFTVNADVEGEGAQESSGSVSVTIGQPPTGCLEIDPAGWPAEYYANIVYARSVLISKYSGYVSKVCSSYPTLSLRYNPVGSASYWGWNHGSYIDFFSLGVKNQSDALYTLAHELGHSFAWGNNTAQFYQLYLETPRINSESPYCFYSATQNWNDGESLPEAIALQVIEPRCGSVKTNWPIHYQFLMKYVFN